MSLQARDMKLLEKIEELTLYIIRQHEEIKHMRGEIENLKEKMSRAKNYSVRMG